MKVDSISSAIPQAPQGESGKAATQQQEFLRLLVAQLQHQNPLDPQDGSEFVAQLAQFSSLEAATETNSRLEGLAAEQASASIASLASFVGRETRFSASSFAVDGDGGEPPPLSARLENGIEKGEAVIYNAAGEEVRRIAIGPSSPGELTIPWDSRSPAAPLPPGKYRVEVTATERDGSEVTLTPQVLGLVDALDLASGAPRLRVGNTTFAPADVVSIH